MKYSDLVQFEPVITIKVLTEADDIDKARTDVRTFVVSQRMLDQLRGVVLPHLQIDSPKDNKGLLTVANYGTGKTHLMSVISSIAEHGELANELQDPAASILFASVAGRFKVIRAEIGATKMSLRDVVCTELEQGLSGLGVTFKFPSAAEVTNNKDSLVEMMAKFETVHPGKGLLFVLDELLDFLRRRKDAELIEDLVFLREVGEICRSTKFRFISGVQEALFDNPRFASVADAVRRVKDRFEQIRISREDVAFVVKERLLRKTKEQRDKVHEHLQQFTPLYEGMAENLADYVALFPVHPAYMRTFEQIRAVEKREVLKTLSHEMERVLNDEVPSDLPGLICYDTYCARLSDDPSTRTIPEVAEVLDKTDVLRSRVKRAMATPQYVPVALRIIDALAVHRLTTDDIYAPIGATAKELRDDLCLLPPNLPEREALFLEATVESVIDQITRAVSGQFITRDADSGQVYLDVRKDIDYDQKIEERAASLDNERLDEAYFHALEEVLELRDAPYVSGYRIWEYGLSWADHRVERIGYLFMGAPNERSTAQPPRDFYVYFLQPYDPPQFVDEERADEVFFRLEKPADEFTADLRRYAGATALAGESTTTHRTVYEDKARVALQSMVTWLRKNMGDAISVTYRGVKQPLSVRLAAVTGPRASVKQQVDSIAASALVPNFESRYPGYPKFAAEITRGNLLESARQALTYISPGRRTELGAKVLQSLGLVDMAGELVDTGEFAAALRESLASSGGKALNRSELLVQRDPGVFTWAPWHLEPVWLAVVAATLTYFGRAELGYTGGQVDALGLDRLSRMSLEELEGFTHVAPPKAIPVVQLREVVKLLDLPLGLVTDAGVDEAAVTQILTRVAERLTEVVDARASLSEGMTIWGAAVAERVEERDARLNTLQVLLQDLRGRNSVGKMNKLSLGAEDVAKASDGLKDLRWVKDARSAIAYLADAVAYLREAMQAFGPEFPLSLEAEGFRKTVLDLFKGEQLPPSSEIANVHSLGEDLRTRFFEEAVQSHNRDRLDGQGDERKRRILEGSVYQDLQSLSAVHLLPQGRFASLQNELVSVGTCKAFVEKDIKESVVCRHCGYQPRVASGPSAAAIVQRIESDLDALRDNWASTLLDALRQKEIREQVDLLDTGDAQAVREYVDTGNLPSPISPAFVRALNQVFERFDVRRVSQGEVWKALFPQQMPATLGDLRTRFEAFIGTVAPGVPEEKVRIVPVEDEEAE